ncbi:hypothetical protein [Ruegeria sp. HKCCD8929]|uniref:hypothetical protein n=1 Tax=Ruegeria sp. HKCCD8929 TaxID=2683006 RepID=UPI0014899FB9|nr:hypothetical protein [Ruegeria sp. HKCCD8929]
MIKRSLSTLLTVLAVSAPAYAGDAYLVEISMDAGCAPNVCTSHFEPSFIVVPGERAVLQIEGEESATFAVDLTENTDESLDLEVEAVLPDGMTHRHLFRLVSGEMAQLEQDNTIVRVMASKTSN